MQQKMASTYWSGSGYYLNAISNDKINGSTKLRRCSVRWEGGFAKVWLPNLRAGPYCKITQFSMSLGCWSDDLDWSFHSLHREIGLHLIRSLKYIKSNDQCKIHQSSRNISLLLYSIHILRVIVSFFSSTLQFATTNRKINMAWEETELTTGNHRFP